MLKDLIGGNDAGRAQLENILARCTYKDFGPNNKLDQTGIKLSIHLYECDTLWDVLNVTSVDVCAGAS